MDQSILAPFYQNLLVTAAIGLIIGLERELNTHSEAGHIGGIRTFTLVAIFGYLAGSIAHHSLMWVIPVTIAAFMFLVAVVYHAQVQQGNSGLTTELSLLATFLLGIFVSLGFLQESLAVVVVITAILSVKEQVHGVIRQITQEELFAFIKFIMLALLVLPLLPDQSFGPEAILNSRELGWIVIIVLSINFAGYLLLKFGGARRGILLTALIGGLFSSTMVAWVFSARSKEKPELSAAYSAGIIVASTVMYVRVLVLAAMFYMPVAWHLLMPLSLLTLVSLLVAYLVFKKQVTDGDNPVLNPGNPFDIKNAAFFAVLYVLIALGMYYSRLWMGQSGAYVSGAISGVADIDAITISTVKWSAGDAARAFFAANVIIIALLSNTVFKAVMSISRGASALRKWVVFGFGPVLIAGIIWLLYRLI